MSDAEFYPLTDSPDHYEDFDDFASLARNVERAPESLNHVVSWLIWDEADQDWEPDDSRSFSVLMFMPRKSATCEKRTSNFTRSEAEAWIGAHVRPRVMRWYGWAD